MKTYTRKQIVESIKYWQRQLKMMNESTNIVVNADKSITIPYSKLIDLQRKYLSTMIPNAKTMTSSEIEDAIMEYGDFYGEVLDTNRDHIFSESDENKMHSIKISDYIEYDEDEFEPGEEWKCTRDSVVNNIKKYYPNVAKIEKIRTVDGSGLKIYSNGIGTLKKIWISLLYADSKYDELVKKGKLENELQSTDFYGCLDANN